MHTATTRLCLWACCDLAVAVVCGALVALMLTLGCADSASMGTDPLTTDEVLHELKVLPRPYAAFLTSIRSKQNYFKNYGSDHDLDVDPVLIRKVSSIEQLSLRPPWRPTDGWRVIRFAEGKGPLDVAGHTGGLCWGGWAQSESGLFKTGRWSVYLDVDENIIGYYFDRFETWKPENGE